MALVVGTNSYGSRAEADTYFNDSLRKDDWSAIAGSRKDQALVEATRVLERQAWAGQKEVSSQTLEFPRTGLTDCQGNSVTAARSLEIIKEAQFEYALLLNGDIGALSSTDATGTNTKRLKAGSAEIEFFRPQEGTRFSVIVHELIGCFLAGEQALAAVGSAFASGTDVKSTFTDSPDSYGVTEGF